MNSPAPGQGWMSFAIPIVVIAVVMALRWRRMSTLRPLKLERLWVVPAIYLGVAAMVFWNTPPHMLVTWAGCAFALVMGAALGWQRGRMMHIEVDPETRSLRQRGSVAAMLFLVGLIVLRTAMRQVASSGGLAISLPALTDGLIAFALGLISLQRVEMYLRAKRLLAGGAS